MMLAARSRWTPRAPTAVANCVRRDAAPPCAPCGDTDPRDSGNPVVPKPSPPIHRHEAGWYAYIRMLTAFGPHAIEVDGRRIAFWRSGDRLVAMDDACCHRAAPLSKGHIINVSPKCSHIVCPYHHIAFDEVGRIVDVPTEKEGRWPKRPLQKVYAVAVEEGRVVLYDTEDDTGVGGLSRSTSVMSGAMGRRTFRRQTTCTRA
jgi:nitrite reductase/ring-hydroxylating ferredoxin subunit